MNLVCVLFIFMTLNFDFVMPVNPQCSYEYYNFSVVGRTYHCDVQNNLNIFSSETAVITGEKGSHSGGKNNDDVHGFFADKKKIEIFPRGLEKIYKNLKFIHISFGRIKEIHQSDLKPFSQLEYLNLFENDIEVLEEGLFDFNPKLGLISFESNKMSQIHSNVFDHLTKLTSLWLHGNQCIDDSVNDNSAAKVKEFIKEVKLQCPSPVSLKQTAIDMHNIKKDLNTCKNSFLEFRPKITKLEATSLSLINLKDNVTSLLASSLSNEKELINLQSQISNLKETSDKIEDEHKQNEKHINTLKTRQDQNIRKIDNLETSLNDFNVSASDVLSKINEIKETVSQQSKDTKKLIIASETRSLQKIHQNMEKVTGEINYLTMESKNNSDKFDKLEAESKTSTREALTQITKLEGLALKQSDEIQEINIKIESSENQIKATTEEILKKIEETEKRLILRQSEDIKAINLKIKYNEELLKALEAHQSTNIKEIEQKYKQEIEIQEKAFNEKMEKLEAASKESNEEIKRKIEELSMKNFSDIQAVNDKVQETEKLINASKARSLEKTNQNIEMLTQQIKNLTKNNSEMEARLAQKQTNDTQDIKSDIDTIKNFIAESYMFHFEKIENLNTSVIEIQKKIKASEVKTLKIMEQNMQTLRQEMKTQINDKFIELEASTKASTDEILHKIEQMESQLISKQQNDVKAINSKIQVIKPSESNSLKRLEADNKNLKILGDSAHERITKLNGYLTSTNNKVNQLEKALNSTDVSLQTLKTETMKIKVMSTNLKDSYNHAFFRLHENMKHIESGLANLNFELILNGIIQSSNDSKLNND